MRRAIYSFSLILFSASLEAQELITRSLPSVQFSFGNPGARSLGMGGAFLALADDASAAESNPAGLTVLRKPEFSIELRDAREDRPFPLRGTFPNIESGNASTRTRLSEIAFASVVVPLEKVSLAGYYHRVTSLRISSVLSEPVLFNVGPGGPISREECDRFPSACTPGFLGPEQTSIDGDLEILGVAAARGFGPLSIGVALRYQLYSQSGSITPFDASGQAVGAFSQVADGGDMTFSAGVKWAPLPSLSVGAVYKSGSSFDAPVFFQPLGTSQPILLDEISRDFPSVAGAGVSIRPIPSLTFNVDALRIGYEDLGRSVARTIASGENVNNYRLDDGTELRAGVEYYFLTRIPFAIRGGWWREPRHTLEYMGPLNTTLGVASSLIFPRATESDHYSIGAGLSWPRFQLDVAFDSSETAQTGSLSLVARF